MAKVKSNPFFSEIRGSVKSDSTFMTRKGKWGIMLHKKHSHRITYTDAQIRERAGYARLSYLWKTQNWIDHLGHEIIAKENYITPWNSFLMRHLTIQGKAPILYLGLDDYGQATAHDYTLYGNNGSITDAEWKRTKKGIPYLYFNGSSSQVTVPYNAIGQLKLPYTILGLFRVDEEKVNNLWTKKLTGETTYYQAYAYYNNNAIWIRGDIDNSTIAYSAACYRTKIDDVFMTAVSADLSHARGYINGELKKTVDVAGQVGDGETDLQVGWHGGATWYLHGNVYLFAVYNRALSDAEIAKIWETVKKFYSKAGLII